MTEWCVSDCGNLKCRHNRLNKTGKDEASADVYMKGNTARGCEGWKRGKSAKSSKSKAGKVKPGHRKG